MSCSLKTCRWLEQCPCSKKFIHTRTRTKMRKLGPRSLNWANYSIHFSREKMQKDAKSIIQYNQKYCVKKPLRSFVGGVGTASPTHCWVQDMAKTFLGENFPAARRPAAYVRPASFSFPFVVCSLGFRFIRPFWSIHSVWCGHISTRWRSISPNVPGQAEGQTEIRHHETEQQMRSAHFKKRRVLSSRITKQRAFGTAGKFTCNVILKHAPRRSFSTVSARSFPAVTYRWRQGNTRSNAIDTRGVQ